VGSGRLPKDLRGTKSERRRVQAAADRTILRHRSDHEGQLGELVQHVPTQAALMSICVCVSRSPGTTRTRNVNTVAIQSNCNQINSLLSRMYSRPFDNAG